MPSSDNPDFVPYIQINGKDLQPAVVEDIVNFTVDTDLFLPAMFSLTLIDSSECKYIDSQDFKVGATVKVEISVEGATKQTLMEGEITANEPIFERGGNAMLRIHGYDYSYRLMQTGTQTKNFVNATEADIVKKVISDASLSCEVGKGPFSFQHKSFWLHDQSAWDFLWSRARLYGCQFYAVGRKIKFTLLDEPRVTGSPEELEWGKALTTFEPRLTPLGQISEAYVRGWDEKTQKEIVGTVKSSNQSGSTAKKTLTNIPVDSVSMAKAIADGEIKKHESNFIQGDGFLEYGNPKVLAGSKVKIKGVGNKFSGEYLVSKATHRYSRGSYTVQFSVSGSSPHTLQALLQQEHATNKSIASGVVIAKVTDVRDPDKQGRVKVLFPWLATDLSSDWIRVAGPGAGNKTGILFMPEVNDEVLIAFEHGDFLHPIVIGGLWSDKLAVPEKEIYKNDKISKRIIYSRTGHYILLDDTDGKEQITIMDNKGETSLVMGKKTITMKAKGDFTIEAEGKITLKSQQDMMMESTGGKITNKPASGFSVDSKAKVELKGAMVELAAQGQANVKGVQVSINGSAMTEIKGGIVKIN